MSHNFIRLVSTVDDSPDLYVCKAHRSAVLDRLPEGSRAGFDATDDDAFCAECDSEADSERDYGAELDDAYEYAFVTTWEALSASDRLVHGWMPVEEDPRLSDVAKDYLLSLWIDSLKALGLDPYHFVADCLGGKPGERV